MVWILIANWYGKGPDWEFRSGFSLEIGPEKVPNGFKKSSGIGPILENIGLFKIWLHCRLGSTCAFSSLNRAELWSSSNSHSSLLESAARNCYSKISILAHNSLLSQQREFSRFHIDSWLQTLFSQMPTSSEGGHHFNIVPGEASNCFICSNF